MDKGIPWSRYLREWSLEDRSIVVAVALEAALKCSACGMTEHEFEADPHAYAAVQVVCPWCAMKDRARQANDTDSTTPGASIRLVPAFVADRLNEVVKAVRPLSRRERARQQ